MLDTATTDSVHGRLNRETLLALSKDDLVTLILARQAQVEALTAQVQMLTARITDLEARLNAPARTPDNSSIPPSKGQKPDLPEHPKKPRRGRLGTCRALAANPDRVTEATLTTCPHCARTLSPANQPLVHAYDHIDLLPIYPIVTRRDVPCTNNACKRALRPSVILRKVTGGFRAEWGANVHAAAATVIATGRLHNLTAFEALRAALDRQPVMRLA